MSAPHWTHTVLCRASPPQPMLFHAWCCLSPIAPTSRDCMHVYTNTDRGQGQPALAGAARSRQETQEPKSSARHTTPRGCRRLQLWSRSQGLKLPSPPCRCCKVTRYASYKVNTITKTRRGSANDLPMTKVTKLETRLDTAQQRRAREGLCLSFQIGRVASAERSPAVVSV